MRVLIFGATGMLGGYIVSYFNKKNISVCKITRDEFDLNDFTYESLENILIEYKINNNTIIINSAGIIPQASKNYKLTEKTYFKINSLFPVMLSSICNKYDSKMIHITTDCVFSGKKGDYSETDEHDASDSYGISKSLGELANCTIIRTSIIGEEKYNKRSLLEWVKSNSNKEINGYSNHIWNGVTCLELAKIIYQIISNNLFWNGVRHIFSPNIINKYELVSLINDVYKLNIKINKYQTDEHIDKSINTIYDTNNIFNIQKLNEQIIEQYNYSYYL